MIMRNSVGLSPFLVLVSLLVGSTVGGPLGAIVAIPLVAGVTVVLGRLQDRDTPVPVDPAGAEMPDEETRTELEEKTSGSPAPKRRRRRSETEVSRA
jgi:hypothetical protein